MALRFLLGASEAAFGPGIPYLLSFFYLRRELGSRCGIFLSAAPLASTFAGALAYGITSGHASIANWRLLFLVEGLPTICLGPIAWFFLPDSPAKARFLDAEEKEVGAERGVRQAGAADRIGGVNFGDILETIKDPKPWFTAVCFFQLPSEHMQITQKLTTITVSSCISLATSHSHRCQSICRRF